MDEPTDVARMTGEKLMTKYEKHDKPNVITEKPGTKNTTKPTDVTKGISKDRFIL